MRWRVSVELAGANGAVEVHEVGVGERLPSCQQRKALQVLDGLSVNPAPALCRDPNTAGDDAPEMEIQLLGNIDLVASDFLL